MLNFDINRKMRLLDSLRLCLWNENGEIHWATILLRHSAKAQVLCDWNLRFQVRFQVFHLNLIDKGLSNHLASFPSCFQSLSMCSGMLHLACHVKEQQLITKIVNLSIIFTKKTPKTSEHKSFLYQLSANVCLCNQRLLYIDFQGWSQQPQGNWTENNRQSTSWRYRKKKKTPCTLSGGFNVLLFVRPCHIPPLTETG